MDYELMAHQAAKDMGMQYNQTVVNAMILIAERADTNARNEMALHMREAMDKFTTDLVIRCLMHCDKQSAVNDNEEYRFGPA